MPAPSEKAAPSAEAANALHRPSRDMTRWRLNAVNVPGVDMTVTPPARARSVSPSRSDRQARWRATREAEQAVSTVKVGPSKPKV